jgi:hypothetical protein
MYDPAVVDAFERIASSMEVSATPVPLMPGSRQQRTAVPDMWIAFDDDTMFAASAGPALMVACRTMGATAGIVFRYVDEKDALVPAVAVGFERGMLMSLEIRLGERLSGWVGASRRRQVDADPRLDLDDKTTLQAAVSTPIFRGDAIVGVMTLYGDRKGCFEAASYDVIDGLVSVISLAKAPKVNDSVSGSGPLARPA